MDIDNAIVAWIERVMAGTVVRVEHQGRWRPHFFIDVRDESGEVIPLLLRMVRDPEFVELSAFLQHFDLAHESRILSRLQGTGVRVPRMYGFHQDPPAILMERVPGSNDLADTDPTLHEHVLHSYIGNLHKLHRIPVDATLAADLQLQIPPDARQLAFAQIGYVEADFRMAEPFIGPEPLLEFALWWLKSNVPQHRTECRWIQGDTGPGQFMVDNGELSALIDWELSHLGDPMLDLGVMRMRNMLYPIGSLRGLFDHYEELSGVALDNEALRFYTVLSTLLSPLGMAGAVQLPNSAIKAMIPMLGWDVTLRLGLCAALAEAYGISIEPPELPEPDAITARSDLMNFLVGHLSDHCLPLGTDDYAALQLNGAVGVAKAAARTNAIGHRLEQDDLDDMERVLSQRPADRESGLRELLSIVDSAAEDRALDLIWLFTRMETRREHLWRPLMVAQQSQPLERLFPAGGAFAGPTETSVRAQNSSI